MLKQKFESFLRFFCLQSSDSTQQTKSSFIFIIQISSLFLLLLLICLVNMRGTVFLSPLFFSSSHMGIINLALLIFLQPKTISLMCVQISMEFHNFPTQPLTCLAMWLLFFRWWSWVWKFIANNFIIVLEFDSINCSSMEKKLNFFSSYFVEYELVK